MTSTIIAWVLVTSSAAGSAAFSPPVATREDCMVMQRVIHVQNNPTCVEVKITK